MRYSVSKDGDLFFECMDGDLGSHGRRRVPNSQKATPIHVLDTMSNRGHLSFLFIYEGKEISERDWTLICDDEDFRPDDLEIVVESDLDVITLCGFASVCINGTARRQEKVTPKYRRPTSKKEVQGSWLYQNATEAA